MKQSFDHSRDNRKRFYLHIYTCIQRERFSYLETFPPSSSSQFLMCLTFRRKMVADCLTSDLSKSMTALTPATVRMKFVKAIETLNSPISDLRDGEREESQNSTSMRNGIQKSPNFKEGFFQGFDKLGCGVIGNADRGVPLD